MLLNLLKLLFFELQFVSACDNTDFLSSKLIGFDWMMLQIFPGNWFTYYQSLYKLVLNSVIRAN